ncbi:MAG: low molecular weight protein arginine phosphatase [bacterium]
MNAKTFHILFVCTGNSCRSPMAEGLLKAMLPPEYKDKVVVHSAGTLGLEGYPATDFAIQVANDYGADISQHRSQGLSEKMLKDMDIIFAMAPDHKRILQNYFPEIRENVFLLRSFGRHPEEEYVDDIEDPIGASLEVYQKCGEIIDAELKRILSRLMQLVKEKVER